MRDNEGLVDHDKLRELADTLTDDQRRLLREGLAQGADVDPAVLTASLKRLDSELMFLKLASEFPGPEVPKEKVPPIGPRPGMAEPPLTRW